MHDGKGSYASNGEEARAAGVEADIAG